jgi:hypothetical protein
MVPLSVRVTFGPVPLVPPGLLARAVLAVNKRVQMIRKQEAAPFLNII